MTDQADAVHRGEVGRGGVRQRAGRRIRTPIRWRRRSFRRPVRSPGPARTVAIDPAETNAFRALNAGVEGERAGEPRRRSLCDQRHERRDARRDRDVAGDSAASASPRRARRSRSRASRCSSRPTAWTPAGRSGCSSVTASSSPASTPPTSPAISRIEFDVIVVGDERAASCPAADSAGRRRHAVSGR